MTDTPPSRPRRIPPIAILYDDEDLQAIDKPVGLATVSERWKPDAPTVIDELWKAWQKEDPDAPKPHVVHRLDRETSGVLLFARHRDAQVGLREQFRNRTIQKSYLAIAQGIPLPHKGTIEVTIEQDPRHLGRMRIARYGGKECQTEYEVIEVFRDLSLVRLRPRTGRTHQIRISLQSIGHPCAVDPLYDGRAGLFVSEWKRGYQRGKDEEERPIIGRVTLHAEELRLQHPRSGEPLVITASLPKDLRSTLRQLRKWHRPPA